jgi:hypothetical protein
MQRPDPSPDEIRLLCEEIRGGWSARERRCRAGVYGSPPPVEVQVFETDSGWRDLGG